MNIFSQLYENSMCNKTNNKALSLVKENAWKSLQEKKIPSKKDETWKYASLKEFSKSTLLTHEVSSSSTQVSKIVSTLDTNKVNIVCVDGKFSRLHSNTSGENGLIVCDLEEAFAKYTSDLEYIETRFVHSQDYFTLVNKALMKDGFFLKLRKGFVLQKDIEITYINSAQNTSEGLPSCFMQNYLFLEENTKANLSEKFYTLDDELVTENTDYSRYFNSVTNLYLASRSSCDYRKVQNEVESVFHYSFFHVILDEAASLDAFFLAFGSKFMRQNCRIDLQGKHARAFVDGLYLASTEQYLDFCVDMIHSSSHAKSSQYFKGIARDKSCGVFQGQIIVKEGAEKTDAQQLNKNLLLDENAQIFTKPQLKIDSDDVKCSHGATVSEINEQELLYLRSRGFSKKRAKEILVRAYIDDLLIKHGVAFDSYIHQSKSLAHYLN